MRLRCRPLSNTQAYFNDGHAAEAELEADVRCGYGQSERKKLGWQHVGADPADARAGWGAVVGPTGARTRWTVRCDACYEARGPRITSRACVVAWSTVTSLRR